MTTATFKGAQIAEDLFFVSVPNHVSPSGQATNVYIAARHRAVLIDAGPDDGGTTVMDALDRFGIESVQKIVLTHAHQDHAGSAAAIQGATGASLHLNPRDLDALNSVIVDLEPDCLLSDGEIIDAGQYRFEVIETPGHAPGHVSLYESSLKALFAGDLISGNGTISVVPPRGSMSDYLASLRRVSTLQIDTIYPGHGPAIQNGNHRITQYIERRESREEEIYNAVAAGVDNGEDITALLYPDVLPHYRRAAAGTVLAHLGHLQEQRRIRIVSAGEMSAMSHFAVS